MNYDFFFENKAKSSFSLKIYANLCEYRWESGGAFGSDWSTNRWYGGIIHISRSGTNWYFFFEALKVRDCNLPEFIFENLFGDMGNFEILDKLEKLSQKSEKSPFPFVEIRQDFKSDNQKTSPNIQMEDAETRISRGEDGFG